jgi:hypothetical protein
MTGQSKDPAIQALDIACAYETRTRTANTILNYDQNAACMALPLTTSLQAAFHHIIITVNSS